MRLILYGPHKNVSMHTHLDMRMRERGWALAHGTKQPTLG